MDDKKTIKLSKRNILIIIFILYVISSVLLIMNITSPNIEDIKSSLVRIDIYDDNNNIVSTGSGFAAFKSNWIVTNFHVIEGAKEIKILSNDNNEYYTADIIIFSKRDDLAIIETNGNLKPLDLGDGNNIKIKDKVTTIGSPMGEKNIVSEGIISNVDDINLIRITAPISHGSSGGVLLDKNYKVIGITNAGYDKAQNLNLAINVNKLKDMYNAYINRNYVYVNQNDLRMCPNRIFEDFENCFDSENGYYKTNSIELFYRLTSSD